MLQYNKPLLNTSVLSLVNKALGITDALRYFKFTEEDSYLRILSRTQAPADELFNPGSSCGKNFVFRYDGPTLMRTILRSSMDQDFQNLFNSFLISSLASLGHRVSRHEVRTSGIREGVEIPLNRTTTCYDDAAWNIEFGTFIQTFMNYYNGCEDLRGTITPYRLHDVLKHKPQFSHGSFKGADRKREYASALMSKVQSRFDQLYASLSQDNAGYFSGARTEDQFLSFVFQLSGCGNETSYSSGGYTQAIPQYESFRNKDGLYAILMLPNARPKSSLQNAGAQEEYNPIYSPLFNAYADHSTMGDAFLDLSRCIIVRLGNFLNQSPLDYTNTFPEFVLAGEHSDSIRRSQRLADSAYNTVGPTTHLVVPDSVYRNVRLALNPKKGAGASLADVIQSDVAKQEWMSLKYKNGASDPYGPTSVFGSPYMRYHGSRYPIGDQGGDATILRAGHRWGSVGDDVFYCWSSQNMNAFKEVADWSGSEFPEAGTWLDSGAPVPGPVPSSCIEGSLYSEPAIGASGGKSRFKDVFTFFSQHPLNHERLCLEGPQSVLSNYATTSNPAERGKGKIFMDHDNIAHCPLSGEALRVLTVLKQAPRNSGYRAERQVRGVVIS